VESSEFESVFQNENLLEQKLHDGKYFSIEKVKLKHRWEIRKTIQEEEKANPMCIESLKREFEIGSQLQHPFICSYYQLSIDGRSIHREYVDGLTWDVYFDTYPDEISIIEKYILQLLQAIHYMHSKGIFHMDLKAENILINHEIKTIKIIDFGHAVYHNDTLWRGGVNSNLKTEKLISAEQDWSAFFSTIQFTTNNISRKSAHKIEKAYKLYIKNNHQIDFQQTKSIFEKESKIRSSIMLIVFSCSILCIFLLFMQLNKSDKKDFLENTKQKATQKLTILNENNPPTIIESSKEQKKLNDNPKKIIRRTISIEDSMFFVNKASLFGPEFEKKMEIQGNLLRKNELLNDLIDEYLLKFDSYAQTRRLDSLQRSIAKNIYNYHISKSYNNYIHLVK
jgi:serine/threonine protein kinase